MLDKNDYPSIERREMVLFRVGGDRKRLAQSTKLAIASSVN